MTEQELQALFEKLQRGIQLTDEEMIALARNSGYVAGQFKRLEVGTDNLVKNFKKAADELPANFVKAAGNTARETAKFTKGLAEARQGFEQLNPIIDAAASALSGIPVIGGMAKATAEASKFMIAQLQSATDAFQDVAKIGGLTARGMSGLQEQFLTSGMQLKSYTKTIAANSAALANFAGSVGSGAEQFSRTAGMVQKQFGVGLQRLGYGIDEIGETTASYIARQTRLGLAQGKSNEVLAAGAAKYALELDELSKLTGASKEELKKQQDAALSESRFRGKIEEMRMNGQAEQAEKLIAAQAALSKQSPALGRAFRDSVSGFIGTSKESVAGFQSLGGEMAGLVDTAMTGSVSDVTNFSRESMKKMLPMFAQLAQMGVDIGIPFSEMADAANGVAKSSKDVAEAQKNQMGPGDKLTNDTVAAQKAMQEMSITIQKLGFDYMPAAAGAVKGFTQSLQTLVNYVSKTIGGAPSVDLGGSGGRSGGGSTPAQKAAARRAASANTGLTGDLGEGPAFGRPDTTRADKVQLTLDEIRDEIKKLVEIGGVAGSPAAMSSAMNAHDAAHKHEPPTITPDAAKELGQGIGSPLKNLVVTSGFGMRTDPFTGKQAGHGGVDLAGKIGDAIMAPEAGIARVVGEAQSGGYGNMVEILNEQGKVIHRMAHMSEMMVKTGDKIAAGAEIGKVGSTGRSTGAHLHWEQFDPTTGKQVDPLAMLAAKQGRGAPKTAGGAPGGATDMTTYMRTVAMLESGGNPNVKAIANGVPSSAGGLYGFLESSWKGLGGTNAQDRFDPAKSTEMMAKFSAQQKVQLEKSLGRGVSGADMYLGHFMGAGGATKFLGARDRDPTQSAAKLDPAAAASNRSIYYNKEGGERSIEEVYQLMTEKYRKQEANVLAGNIPALVAGITGTGTLSPGTSPTLATPTAPMATPTYTAATAGLAGQGQNVISSGLQAVTTSLFGGGAQGAPGAAAAGGGSEVVTLLTQLVALSRDQNSNLSKILSASTA